MINILNTTACFIAYAGMIYAVAYSAMNLFFSTKVSGLDSRNKSFLSIISKTILFSYILNFIPCVLTDVEQVTGAMEEAAKRYSDFTVVWLCILALIGAGNLFMFVSPKFYSEVNKKSMWKLAKMVIIASIVGGFLAWLIA